MKNGCVAKISRKRSSVVNACQHWKDHRNDFPDLVNAKQYVEAAHSLARSPPAGTLKKIRVNGDAIFYNPKSNTFAITNKLGVPRTIYKQNIQKHPHSTNMDITMQKDRNYTLNCRVCGLDQGFEPWGEDGKTPSFIICGCCGVEFVYEDCTVEYVKKFREEWIKNGVKRFRPKRQPKNWSLVEQMKNIPEEFR